METLTASQDGDIMSNFHQIYDLIVLDLNMPITDGYVSCKNIKKLYDK